MPFYAFGEIHSPRNSAKSDVNRLFDGGSSYGRRSYAAKQRYHTLKNYLEEFGSKAAEETNIEKTVWDQLQELENLEDAEERKCGIESILEEFPMTTLLTYFMEHLPESFKTKVISEDKTEIIHEFIRRSIISSVFTKHDNKRRYN
jgi:hypothetical protein